MAGERLQPEDFVEVSGICTHPDFRGRGLAAALTRIVTQRILDEGKTPFLHAYASNTGAISVYQKLGFEHRCDVTHAMWTRA
jgi:predicted GNAT family acetyltransferase